MSAKPAARSPCRSLIKGQSLRIKGRACGSTSHNWSLTAYLSLANLYNNQPQYAHYESLHIDLCVVVMEKLIAIRLKMIYTTGSISWFQAANKADQALVFQDFNRASIVFYFVTHFVTHFVASIRYKIVEALQFCDL